MSGDGDRKPGPLWKFVPLVGDVHVPHIKRTAVPVDPRVLPREPDPDELMLLRSDGDWRPAIILRRFGPAKEEKEHLSRLIVACAVLHGAHRVKEAADRLAAMLNIAIPRVQRMVDDKALDRRKADLKNTLDRMLFARDDLPATRARATNDSDRAHPDGLRFIDLRMLMIHAEAAVLGSEIATKRNLTGIDYAMNLAQTSPDQRYATEWVERTLGAPLAVLGSGILLFVPPEYGRVVVVHADGRLAFDPGAPLEDED